MRRSSWSCGRGDGLTLTLHHSQAFLGFKKLAAHLMFSSSKCRQGQDKRSYFHIFHFIFWFEIYVFLTLGFLVTAMSWRSAIATRKETKQNLTKNSSLNVLFSWIEGCYSEKWRGFYCVLIHPHPYRSHTAVLHPAPLWAGSPSDQPTLLSGSDGLLPPRNHLGFWGIRTELAI